MAASKKIPKIDPSVNGEKVTSETETVMKNGVGFIGSASKIVLKAASILEEEIARGIVAAKQVEEKFTDVSKIRGGKITDNKGFDDLFVRFRKDAHDIIDLVVDFAAIAAQNTGKLTSQFIKISTDSPSGPETSTQQVPLIQVPKELQPGMEMEFPISIENDNAKEEKSILFVHTPLSNTSGNQLPSEALLFLPNPLKISALSKATVTVKISIPANAKAGNYTSFVQGQDTENLKATLLVKVV